MLIFGFLLVRLPKADVTRGVAVRGALLASVGFEILKLFGTYYIAHVATSPTAGIFGSIIGVLVWLNLVFRFLLYCTAWTATATDPALEPDGPVPAAVARARRGGGPAAPAPPESAPARPASRGLATVLVAWALLRRRG